MINAEKISEMVRNPLLAGSTTAAEILEVQQKFPYCSTLHLLYLKNLALTNDVQFEDRLRYAAAHIMDRERMYHLVHSEKEVADFAGQAEPVLPEETQVVRTGTPEKTALPETASFKNEVTPKTEPAIKPDTETDELIEETILPSVATSVFEKELGTAVKDDEVTQTAAEAEASQDIEAEKPGNQNLEDKIDLSKLSFVEWLRYKQGKPAVLPAEADSETQNSLSPAKSLISEKPGSSGQEAMEKETKKRKTLSKTDVNEILNKFITEEPSISRPKTEFFNPVKNAKQSLEETPGLVTETLAKIYILQKNYTKALQAYEQLILVYPEKKAFFATQIQKIKDELPK